MSNIICSAPGFLRWAKREKGPRWFEDSQLLQYYGRDQLSRLYPEYFVNDEKKQMQLTKQEDYYIKYPTPFDEPLAGSFQVPVQNKDGFQIVKNIFNLDYSFDSSKVNLNTDRLLNEVNGIYNKESTRKGRTYEQVLESTIMGHKLEQYLLDNNDFIDDERKYMDLLSPSGASVDCKVVTNWHSGTAKYLVDKILARASFSPKINYVVIYQNINGIYEYRETIQIF